MNVNERLRWIAIVLLLSTLAGCQTTDPSVELLESELRWREDQLYSLDRQLEQKCQQLASCRRSNEALRREVERWQLRQSTPAAPSRAGDHDSTAPRSTVSPRSPSSNQGPATPAQPPSTREPANGGRGGQIPRADDLREEDLQVPDVDLGTEDGAAPESEAAPGSGAKSAPQDAAPGDDEAMVETDVARIVLNSRLTGGYDFDGQPGDEGLLLVVEPQNMSGRYLPLPGDLIVTVTDPSHSGPASQFAKWEFAAAETVPHLKRTLLGNGIHLQLPWPNHPPESHKLRVAVAYRNLNGHVLTARRDFQVDLIADEKPAGAERISQTDAPPWPLERNVAVKDLLPEQMLQPPAAPLAARALDETAPQLGGPRLSRNPAPLMPRTTTLNPAWQPYR